MERARYLKHINDCELHASLLAVFGYVLLGDELCVVGRSEHVITVPGDTVVVGDNVEVRSACRACPT